MNNVTNVLVAFVLVRLTGLFLSKKKKKCTTRNVEYNSLPGILKLGRFHS